MKNFRIATALAAALLTGWLPLQAQKSHGGGAMGAGAGHGAMGAPSQRPNLPQGQPAPGNRGTMPHDNKSAVGHGTMTDTPAAPKLSQKSSADQLPSFPKLTTHLEGFFPAGTNLTTAASGFKNLGDFVAAAHVSRNLDIPFDQLKGKMMGGAKLGQAIHELRPDADSKAEASRATKEAKKALKDYGS